MSRKSDQQVNRYIAHRLNEILPPEGQRAPKGKLGLSELARKLDIAPATLGNIRWGKAGVGYEVLRKFAAYFKLTTTQIEEAATAWCAAHPEFGDDAAPADDPNVRYPNQAKAAALAKGYLSDEGIDHVLAKVYDLREDKHVAWWYERMQAADAEFKAMRLDPGKADRDTQKRLDGLAQIKREQGGEE